MTQMPKRTILLLLRQEESRARAHYILPRHAPLRMEIDILQALNTEPTISTRRINGFNTADVLHKRFAYCTIGVVDIQHTIFLPSYSP